MTAFTNGHKTERFEVSLRKDDIYRIEEDFGVSKLWYASPSGVNSIFIDMKHADLFKLITGEAM